MRILVTRCKDKLNGRKNNFFYKKTEKKTKTATKTHSFRLKLLWCKNKCLILRRFLNKIIFKH